MEAQKIKQNIRETTSISQLALSASQIAGIVRGAFLDFAIKYTRFGAVDTADILPKVAGFSNDPSSVGRASAYIAATKVLIGLETSSRTSSALEQISAQGIQLIEAARLAAEVLIDEYSEIRGELAELSRLLQREEPLRVALGQHIQRMEILRAEIDTLVSEGFRIMEEREAFNSRIAATAQRNRYSDMVKRLSRNESLSQYESAFQHALRYAWLAARAYEYETSLDPGHPAAATSALEALMEVSQLGLWENGEPRIGNGGLAEILAQLKANFDTLEGQLGINNPQFETGLLSLRSEHFRIGKGNTVSDDNWMRQLAATRVDDLWALPEYRRYCRPGADPEDGPLPGLVIEFATEITPERNVFGRELGAGDHAYSVANFATKISSVGVWFEGYTDAGLATTPRVYLVPAGSDVLRISDADTPTERIWNVTEQVVPTPYAINQNHLTSPNFIPSLDSRNGSFAQIRRYGDLRAYAHDGGDNFDPAQMRTDSRLVGRSVWNTRWLLIIPGNTLHANPNAGLDQFIQEIDDIRLQFETYSHQGR